MTKPRLSRHGLSKHGLIAAGVTLAALWPASAWAHPGHGVGGFGSGLLHPLTGIDHLSALLLAGVCGGFLLKSRPWLLPLGFLVGMGAGFATGAITHANFAETLIVVSVIVLGLAALLRARVPAAVGVGAVALFGYAHGMAHGIETPRGALPVLFACGFLLTSGAVEAMGLWLARVLPAPALRLLGAAGAALGVVLAVGS